MTITHESCQAALAEGRPYDERVDEHAATCDTCAAFARALDRLDAATSTLAAARAPEALAERTVEAVTAAARLRAVPGAPRFPAVLFVRSAVAAAAAVILVVASVAVLDRRDHDPERMVLISAARDLEEAGSARVDVDASAEFAAEVGPDRRPRYEGVPPEVRGYLEVEWERMMADLDRQIAELEGRIDQMLTESERQMNEAMNGALGGGGSTTPPTRPPRQPPAGRAGQSPPDARSDPRQPPAVASVGLRVVAGGAVDFGGSTSFEGTVTPVSGTVDAPAAAVAFGVASDAGTNAVRDPAGAWTTVSADSQAPLAGVLLDGRALPALLRSAEGDVEVRAGGRYRFITAHAGQRWQAEADIDSDDRVRRVTLTPVTGSGTAVAALSIRMEVGAGGVERGTARTQASAAVTSATRPAPDAGSPAVFPLGAPVRTAFGAGQR